MNKKARGKKPGFARFPVMLHVRVTTEVETAILAVSHASRLSVSDIMRRVLTDYLASGKGKKLSLVSVRSKAGGKWDDMGTY